MKFISRHMPGVSTTVCLMLCVLCGGILPNPASASESRNVVIIGGASLSADGWDDSAANVMGSSDGGWLPLTGPVNELGDFVFSAMTPGNVSAANLAAFDTAVLNVGSSGIASNMYAFTSQQKADLVAFVASGKKLVIFDSESPAVDYGWLPYPFTTSNPGGNGAHGSLTVVEDGDLASYNPANPAYTDAAVLDAATDASGDMNVMTSYDSNWQISISGTNYLNATGPALAYTRYPASSEGGVIIYNGLSQDYQYYDPTLLRKIWVQSLEMGNAAYLVPPVPVTGFAASAGNKQVALSWMNPPDADFTATAIRFRTDTYPAGPADGTLLTDKSGAPGSAAGFIHTSLANGVTYYYAAFAHDLRPNYSSVAQASATPAGDALEDWVDENFDAYPNGNLAGLKWTTVAAASAQVQSTYVKGSAGKAILLDTVASGESIANEIAFIDKTAAYYWLSFDIAQDATGSAGQEIGAVVICGSDSATEIGRLRIQKSRMFLDNGSGSLATVYTSVANGTWYNLRIGVNLDTHKLDVWMDGSQKVINLAWRGGALKFSRVVLSSDRNSSLTTQKVYIDNLRVEPKPGQVAVVNDDGGWSPSLSKLHFSFAPVAGASQYRYCIGLTAGGAQTRDWTSTNTATDVVATGLSLAENSSAYYVTVQCANVLGTYGASRTSSGIRVAPGLASINAAKALANGNSSTIKSLRGKVVSAAFSGYFYVQEPGTPLSAMRVVSAAAVIPGDLIDAAGFMGGAGEERYMDCTGNGVIRTIPGIPAPHPIGMPAKLVGGKDLIGIFVPGVVGGQGLNNVGLFVTVLGKVTQRQPIDPKYFYIDDGCGLIDGTTTGIVNDVGIRIAADPAPYPAGSYVVITGVASAFGSGGLRPLILPVSIQTMRVGP